MSKRTAYGEGWEVYQDEIRLRPGGYWWVALTMDDLRAMMHELEAAEADL